MKPKLHEYLVAVGIVVFFLLAATLSAGFMAGISRQLTELKLEE